MKCRRKIYMSRQNVKFKFLLKYLAMPRLHKLDFCPPTYYNRSMNNVKDNYEHYEIERRFLIAMPDEAVLSACAERTDIVQTYLAAQPGETARVRMRGANGRYTYTHTVKTRITAARRVECEREITAAEYAALLKTADPQKHVIRKSRYCLPYCGRVFEIDVFPFWQDRAIMEIELGDENENVVFPTQVHILKEITADGRYTNAAMAVEVPYDEI